jgi:hypothetical protein
LFAGEGLAGEQEAGGSAGALGVAEVGFAEGEVERGRARAGEAALEGGDLGEVAESGAAAEGGDEADLRGGEVGVAEGGADDRLLGAGVGGDEAVAGAVLADGGAAEDSDDRSTGGLGAGEVLEDEHDAAVGAQVTVGAGVHGPAAAGRGEHAHAGEGEGGVGREDEVDAADEGPLALAAADRLDREVDGEQGGGAGGVEGEGGAGEAEGVGDAAGGHRVAVAGAEAGVDARVAGLAEEAVGVVVVADADVDAGAAAAEILVAEVGALCGGEAGLEQEALLRVHGGGLAGGDAEAVGGEAVDVGEPAAVERTGAAGGEADEILLPVLGDRSGEVAALAEGGPQSVGGVDVAGQAQADADDRHRGGAGPLEGGDALAGAGEGLGGALEVGVAHAMRASRAASSRWRARVAASGRTDGSGSSRPRRGRRCWARAARVGCSSRTVGGRATPRVRVTVFCRSTAMRESRPRSLSGRRGSIAAGREPRTWAAYWRSSRVRRSRRVLRGRRRGCCAGLWWLSGWWWGRGLWRRGEGRRRRSGR